MKAVQKQRPWRASLFVAALAYYLFEWLPAAHAAGKEGVGENFLWLAVILLAANIAARRVERFHMPGVLGELLGNL